MNPIFWAMWSYWWRAAPWAWSGHLMASFPDVGIPISNGINDLRGKGCGHLGGRERAATPPNPGVLKLWDSTRLAETGNPASDHCTACGQPGHVAASCAHELWRPR